MKESYMSVDKIFNDHLKQSVEVNKNVVNFLTEGTHLAIERAQQQQREALKTSLDTAVKGGQLKESAAQSLNAWYENIWAAQAQLFSLQRDHLVKNMDELANLNPESASHLMKNYTDYLTQTNLAHTNNYSAMVQTAQDLFTQGLSSFKEKSQPVVDAAAEVIKKTRGKTATREKSAAK